MSTRERIASHSCQPRPTFCCTLLQANALRGMKITEHKQILVIIKGFGMSDGLLSATAIHRAASCALQRVQQGSHCTTKAAPGEGSRVA